jgi:glycosyltransferase involved in cell wall biosynthesis
MKVSIFLICYNEEVMLPHTLKYYKKRFPSADIYIVDNHSTDASCTIAEEHGCKIVSYDTNNSHDETILLSIRSHKYKEYVTDSWVLMCDMDEWLDITEEELAEEEKKGVTVIKTQGVNMVGESARADLSDIQVCDIKLGFLDENFSKRVCFKYPQVSMEYWYGAHKCWPIGHVVYSEKAYFMRHYNYLGAEYLVEKHRKRYERNGQSRQKGLNGHYKHSREEAIQIYEDCLRKATPL